MRIYEDCYEMVREVERDLFEMGVTYESETVQDKKLEGKARDTMELFGYAYALKSDARVWDMVEYMKGNVKWIKAEIDERTMGSCVPDDVGPFNLNPGIAWQCMPDFWKQYLRDGRFSYTYAERLTWQIPYVLYELRHRPNSRHAVITMYDQHQDLMNWGGRDRVPCSMHYQFLIRNNKLHCIYSQRSCDFLKFFAADVAITLGLHRYIARGLNQTVGDFTHFLGSVHAFKTDLEARGIY
jgi:thymidylate synthase